MISFKIYSGETLNRERWSILAEKSLMASPDFVAVWQNSKIRPVFFALEENERILAGMPGVLSGGRLMPRFESMIDGFPGGAIAVKDDPDIKLELYKRTLDYFRKNRFFRATIHDSGTETAPPEYRLSTHLTHILDLDDPEAGRDRSVNIHIRTGKRRDAEVVVFNNPGWLHDFHGLVAITSGRHKTVPRYDKTLFERLLELSRTDRRIIWIAAQYEDRLIASSISFILGDRILNWQGCSDREHGNLKANYLLMDYIIGRARELGINKIDLGGSPRDAEGLIEFKKRWGGRETEVKSYTYYSAMGALYYRWKNR